MYLYFSKRLSLILIPTSYFLLYLPIVLQINFYQNDDWYYYKQVELFLQFKFRLLNDIAPSFYGAGIPASLFAYFFGLQNIPILTLIVSTLSVFVFLVILKINKITGFAYYLSLLSFIFFPIFSYSVLGFMTENYFLLYVLASLLFFNLFINKNNTYLLIFAYLLALLSFFVKQNGIVLLFIYFIYLLYIKNYKQSVIAITLFIGTALFYFFIFPKTFEMTESKFSILTFLPLNVAYVVYNTLCYFLVFSAGFFSFIKFKKVKLSKINLMVIAVILVTILTQLYFYSKFKLFPYFGNTYSYLGFLYGSIEGPKPAFKFIPSLFILYTYLAPLMLILFLTYLYINNKIFKDKIAFFYFSSFVVFSVFNQTIAKFYDRYLLIPFVLFLLFLANYFKNYNFKVTNFLVVSPILLANIYLIFVFSIEFVTTNNYAWNKAFSLVNTNKIEPSTVFANGAFNEKYSNKGLNSSKFYISWEKPHSVTSNFTKIEEHTFKNLNLFVKSPTVYIYKNLNYEQPH